MVTSSNKTKLLFSQTSNLIHFDLSKSAGFEIYRMQMENLEDLEILLYEK